MKFAQCAEWSAVMLGRLLYAYMRDIYILFVCIG